ncbi:hypothetical protein IWX49DRAFT_594944 [Phyllosticta citricarpa]|uniref:Uncharacterized protein n=2 Tax=Phyllosticta TaxID=121621 RepID=A0ABR1LVZ9_9PEZI
MPESIFKSFCELRQIGALAFDWRLRDSPKTASPVHVQPLPNTIHHNTLQDSIISLLYSLQTSPPCPNITTKHPQHATMENLELLIGFIIIMAGLTMLLAIVAMFKHCHQSRKEKKKKDLELKSRINQHRHDKVFWHDVLADYNNRVDQASRHV